MLSIGPIIAASGDLSIAYAERLLIGVTPETFARLARPGGVTIQSNHAAWVLGHLSLYPARIMATLGQPGGATTYPERYESLFKNGTDCQDDPNGALYPRMDELTGFFFRAYKAAVATVNSTVDEVFLKLNPAEGRMRELFPTVGAAVNFYLGGHMQNHLGQFSAWRRAMGLPAA
jgi:hypothetical protein